MRPYMPFEHYSRQRRLLSFCTAVFALTGSFVVASLAIPMMAIWTAELQLDSSSIALTTLYYFLGCIVILLFFARISNFCGRKIAVILSLGLTISASLIFAHSTSSGELYVARFLQGLACGIASSAGMAWVVDTAPPGKSWLGTALTAAGPNIGLAVGTLVTGLLLTYSGLQPFELFYLTIALLVLCLILTICSIETMPLKNQSLLQVLIPKIVLPTRLRRIFVLSVTGFACTWSVGSLLQGFAAFLTMELFGHTDPLLTGLTYLLYILPNAVAGVVFGRFNAARLMPVVTSLFVFSALGLFGCYHFSFIPGFALAILLVGLTAGGVVVASLRLLIMDTSLTERSGVIAAIYLGGYIGSGTPNLIIGMLPAVSMDGISLGYSVWVLVSFAIVIFMLRKINRQPTAAEKLRFKRERPLLK